MKITKQNKKEISKKFGEKLKETDVIFTDFHGLKFKEINSLRQGLKELKSNFSVTRNTIIYHALKNAKLEIKDDNLTKGPTAVITLEDSEEITRVAKALFKFAKDNPSLRIKGGFLSREWLAPSGLERLSKIGSKQERLGQLVSTLYSNMSRIRFVLEAPVRDLSLILSALKDKKEKEEKK